MQKLTNVVEKAGIKKKKENSGWNRHVKQNSLKIALQNFNL